MSGDDTDQHRKYPPEIGNALAVLATLRAEAPDIACDIEDALPAFAAKLARAGENTSYAALLSYARKGKTHLDTVVRKYDERAKTGRNYTDIVANLPEPPQKTETLNERMLRVARAGDTRGVRAAVADGADIRVDDDEMIQIAARLGHLEMVQYCHEQGCDIRAGSIVNEQRRDVVLYHAVALNNTDMLDYWWRHVRADYQDSLNAALMEAAEYNHFEMLCDLHHQYGADITAPSDRPDTLSRVYSVVAMGGAYHGNKDMLDYALSCAVDDEHKPYILKQVLLKALARQQFDIAGHLYTQHRLQKIEEEEQTHDAHELILRNAAQHNRKDIIDYWLNIISLAGYRDHYAQLVDTTMRVAAEYGHYPLVQQLYETLDDNDLSDTAWQELFDAIFAVGIKNHRHDLVRFAHERGAAITEYEQGAFIWIGQNDDIDNLRYMYEQGCDLASHAELIMGEAAIFGSERVLQFCHQLGHPLDFEVEDLGKNIVLGSAIMKGHMGIVDYCLRHGCETAVLPEPYEGIADYLRERLNRMQQMRRKNPAFEGLTGKKLASLNPDFYKGAAFDAAYKILEKEGISPERNTICSYRLSALFGNEDRILNYLERWGTAGDRPLYELARDLEMPEEGKPDVKAWGDAVLKHGPKMGRLVKYADQLTAPKKCGDGSGWSFKATQKALARQVYDYGPDYPDLAYLCFRHGWSQRYFNRGVKLMRHYQKKRACANDNQQPGWRIPDIRLDGGQFHKPGYSFYKLPPGDERGAVIGNLIDNCQHLARHGMSCTTYGFLSPNSGFYVVADNDSDSIVAGIWAWRGNDGELVLDSLEGLSGHFNQDQWSALLGALADELESGPDDVTALKAGAGGHIPSRDFARAANYAQPIDYAGYSDAYEHQYDIRQFSRGTLHRQPA